MKEEPMFGIGTPELIVIGVIVFLIFGAKRIPEIGKGLGGAIREFRQVKKDLTEDGQDKQKLASKAEKRDPLALEDKVKDKVLDQVPAVKQAMDMKNKVDKVRDFMKS
jgi:sec-independent protein translocase protein TatA